MIILSSKKTNFFVVSLIFSLFSFFLSAGVQDLLTIIHNPIISFSIPYILAIVSIIYLFIGYIKLAKSNVKSSGHLKFVPILTIIIIVLSILINSFLLVAVTSGI